MSCLFKKEKNKKATNSYFFLTCYLPEINLFFKAGNQNTSPVLNFKGTYMAEWSRRRSRPVPQDNLPLTAKVAGLSLPCSKNFM